jgi:hypothetical protein
VPATFQQLLIKIIKKTIATIAIAAMDTTGIKKLGISFSPFHYLIFKVPFIYL